MSELLKDKVCMVTGTARGIGQRIAELFASEGGIVYATARSEGSLDAWAKEKNGQVPGELIPLYFDMTDSAGIKGAVIRLKKERGRLDVLVNNAGMICNERLGMISIERMKQMFDVNVFGLMELSQLAAVKLMLPHKSGSIVNIASIVGVEGSKGQTAYSASKGAVISITRSMAKELAAENIRVNAVAPGMIATERLEVKVKEQYQGIMPKTGMERWGAPEDVAKACLYFASDMSLYTTGQIMSVSGGNDTLSRVFYDIDFK
ncbi:MAG: SDR family oxidoreductase [Lachnospiraceae bacterium]|nr:SDR family oxidoreductase [Lachnospiraceae bacterium]